VPPVEVPCAETVRPARAECPEPGLVRDHGPTRAATASPRPAAARARIPLYAALDLGTNNCRLLIARPGSDGFRVVDAFSRIVRLGEGLGASGTLSGEAVARTIDALRVCAGKMELRGVTRSRLIATQACRAAENGNAFIDLVARETGLRLEIVDRETEAHLAVAGCAALADPKAESILLFDIGGGSSEIVWLDGPTRRRRDLPSRVRAWTSLPLGVVTLAEQHGGIDVSEAVFRAMVDKVRDSLAPFIAAVGSAARCDRFHILGTSGTVTTIAGVHLELQRYDRRRVDGAWMTDAQVSTVIDRLVHMTYDERVANACIGRERADLVLAGCAILEAIREAFPSPRVRIADRGLREGILMQLMAQDGLWRHRRDAHR
jgi:exopolyphosphatase / guanosine-5'-triphosphate,3'-diphosphate pyrophosphatase